ncbi:MAG TPA: 6-carboxytetrahydropterin synthase [Persephonella sp.]|uniref:6-carboxy-5,6,7,8-tetrahydropterin synthase n=1 Tax=Persephonella marina (strain DSM 14350 / EX-H1) TaxID=123214 RepID=C0QR57_PERMH|nr:MULTISPECIES: 6-carboxytetrahydropterin synthase [Persephonella]ACO03817.1 putative 6-pyruvoyl tetrahydrobiopterin synthase (ptps)(ptp synthase) [Persephonella marina EX-H1]HCB68900.1 6-carboxytetrahydropterin synthase [Persephonella sp.]
MRYEITKRFKFEAGHRVWKQNLSSGKGAKLMADEIPPNPCINIHGHSYKVEVTVGSDKLNEQEMVIDFYHIKSALKDLIDNQLDHSFIIDKNDPLFPKFKENFGFLKLTVVDFCPTAEALAKYIYDFLEDKLREAGLLDEIKVVSVTIWETETGKAVYKGK